MELKDQEDVLVGQQTGWPALSLVLHVVPVGQQKLVPHVVVPLGQVGFGISAHPPKDDRSRATMAGLLEAAAAEASETAAISNDDFMSGGIED